MSKTDRRGYSYNSDWSTNADKNRRSDDSDKLNRHNIADKTRLSGKPDGKKTNPSSGQTPHYYSRKPESASVRETIIYNLPHRYENRESISALDDSVDAPTGVQAGAVSGATVDALYNEPYTNPTHDNRHGQNAGTLAFITDSGVFSKRRVDFGTDLLIRALPKLSGRALDLGCGYGVAGISLMLLNPGVDMWFADINERAIALCRENFERIIAVLKPENYIAHIYCSDGFTDLGNVQFDTIITNPPVRVGKKRLYKLYEETRERLVPGGSIYLVIQKKQGMESTYNELNRLFGNCSDIARKAGYHVLRATRINK